MNLYERMQQVLAMHPEWSTRDWARAAGLTEESHVATILGRLKRDPRKTISARTIAALARGAGVSVEWLSTGQGSPRAQYIMIEPDPLYPTRASAIAAARLFGWDNRAIEKIRAVKHFPFDPGLDYWRRSIESEHLRAGLDDFARAGAPSPDGPGSTPLPVKRSARRKSG